MKINKVKAVFFRELVNLCKKVTCLGANPYFIINAFEIYEKSEDFF